MQYTQKVGSDELDPASTHETLSQCWEKDEESAVSHLGEDLQRPSADQDRFRPSYQ
jgi:hypothetical protein